MHSGPETEHFCTLFDSGYLPQGLALHATLLQHEPQAMLWVLCIDDAAHDALVALALPQVQPLRLSEVETPELLAVKPGRSRGEYCWTLTSFLIGHVLKIAPACTRATYLDADLYFLRSPSLLFQELDESGKSALITEHDYLPQYDESRNSGRFCVQFMPFRNDPAGWKVLGWWQARCLEWCYNRIESGRFGDQMYLDAWPELFKAEVHVLARNEYCQAPWNAGKHDPSQAVFYHMHRLRIFHPARVRLWLDFRIPARVRTEVYATYARQLSQACTRLRASGVEVRFSAAPELDSPRKKLGALVRRLMGTEAWAQL